jgi:GT2 family glycosyltransferase
MTMVRKLSVGRAVTLSIVSHGQGQMVRGLLGDLAREGLDCDFGVSLTLNIPEKEDFLDSCCGFPVEVARNSAVRGFGANHNAAFGRSRSRYFAVVNPDIRLNGTSLAPILETLAVSARGACGPAVYSPAGAQEDSARRFPTVRSLAAKLVSRKASGAYPWGCGPIEVDWIAGMFMVFPRAAFERIHGFDERYFMYYEDADICRRLRRAGWSVWLDPRASVIHDARRRSHRDLRHLRWHVASAVRFLATG